MAKGRPKQHSSATERFRAYRDRMKQAGYKRLTFEVPQEFKAIFDRLCEKHNVTAREMFCILVAHYEEEEEARAQPETTSESEIERMSTTKNGERADR